MVYNQKHYTKHDIYFQGVWGPSLQNLGKIETSIREDL